MPADPVYVAPVSLRQVRVITTDLVTAGSLFFTTVGRLVVVVETPSTRMDWPWPAQFWWPYYRPAHDL